MRRSHGDICLREGLCEFSIYLCSIKIFHFFSWYPLLSQNYPRSIFVSSILQFWFGANFWNPGDFTNYLLSIFYLRNHKMFCNIQCTVVPCIHCLLSLLYHETVKVFLCISSCMLKAAWFHSAALVFYSDGRWNRFLNLFMATRAWNSFSSRWLFLRLLSILSLYTMLRAVPDIGDLSMDLAHIYFAIWLYITK